jgi:hypothetical protein
MSDDVAENLRVAERIAQLLEDVAIPAVVIGAIALAAHRYVRFTEDIDLGVDADLKQMRALAESCRSEGYRAELHEPDGDDPLGGVIDVSGSFGLVQIISFHNGFPAAIRDALRGEKIEMRPGSRLRIVPIPQLVALKMYAGGLSSRADIIELLRRNPEVDLTMLAKTCCDYRLRVFGEIIKELRRLS